MNPDRLHKGDTPGKRLNRYLVWAQHRALLRERFYAVPHAFLASRHAGDVGCLDQLAVPRRQIWAVEKDHTQYRELAEKAAKLGFSLFTRPVEQVAATETLSSVYLDYCGNLNGCRRSITRVVEHLPSRSVVSVTLFIGRERDKLSSLEAREKPLRELLRVKHGASLAQFVYYQSDDSGVHGSPMGTWTFYLGPLPSRGKMKFDLTHLTLEQLRAADPERHGGKSLNGLRSERRRQSKPTARVRLRSSHPVLGYLWSRAPHANTIYP